MEMESTEETHRLELQAAKAHRDEEARRTAEAQSEVKGLQKELDAAQRAYSQTCTAIYKKQKA